MPTKTKTIAGSRKAPAPVDDLAAGNGHVQTRKRVAILGTAPTMTAAPHDDERFEIWVCSPCLDYKMFSEDGARVSRIFEMHSSDYWDKPDILRRLNAPAVPVFMLAQTDAVPKSVAYPSTDVLTLPNGSRVNANFTNSIAYMIALAIHEGAHEISLFGVAMAAEEEYDNQRTSCAYWMAVADTLGIDTFVAEEIGRTMVMPEYQYGYQSDSKLVMALKLRRDGMRNGIAKCEKDVQEAVGALERQRGAVGELDHIIRESK